MVITMVVRLSGVVVKKSRQGLELYMVLDSMAAVRAAQL